MSDDCKDCGHDINDHDGPAGCCIVWNGPEGHETRCPCQVYVCPCGEEGCRGA